LHDAAAKLARFSSRYAIWIVACWLAGAGIANLAVPRLEQVVNTHSRAFMPADSASSVAARSAAELLGEPPSNNLNYIVLERDRPLGEEDRAFYDRLVKTISADAEHVQSITDLWTDPATSAAAQSADSRAVTVMTRLSGMIGTSQATDSVSALRDAVARLGPPQDLHNYVTGPGATIADEFTAIDRQMLGITAATVGLILLLLLVVYRSPSAQRSR
jgi:RND superfamily putative drug exporter